MSDPRHFITVRAQVEVDDRYVTPYYRYGVLRLEDDFLAVIFADDHVAPIQSITHGSSERAWEAALEDIKENHPELLAETPEVTTQEN